MSKELTEKWKNGELKDGYYYIDYDTQQKIFEVEDGCATYQGLPAETYFLDDICLIKVLAPVPSYDEWKQAKENLDKNGTWYTERSYKLIEKKLEIATKDLEELEKENKKLKAQLEEANSDGLESIHWFGSDHF